MDEPGIDVAVRADGSIVTPAPEGVKQNPDAWMAFTREARVGSPRGHTVVLATLDADTRPDTRGLIEALAGWSGRAWIDPGASDGSELVLVGPPPPRKRRPLLRLALFVATVFTTLQAGAMLAGVDPLSTVLVPFAGLRWPVPSALDWSLLGRGALFAAAFLGVLLAHEMAHWVAARRHGVDATLPTFLPVPAYVSLVGTLGAFIRIRGPIVRRSTLLDIGASGPVASFVVSLPLLIYGLTHSTPTAGWSEPLTPFVVRFADQAVWLGTGPLVAVLAHLFAPEAPAGPLLLHPLALAGWLGLFVTALNLLPVGQLDGGHVLYALAGDRQARWAPWALFALLPLGFLWMGWWVWGVLAVLVNRRRVVHPTVLQPGPSPRGLRRAVGIASILVFFLTFVPVPLRL